MSKIPTIKYTGKINEVPLGTSRMMSGGQGAYSFHSFEGQIPHRPLIALDLWDYDPGEDWPEAARAPYQGVMGDPGAWAAACVEYGADLVTLHLKSSDPAGRDTGPAEALENVGRVLEAVKVPVIVYGVGIEYKDKETLTAVSEKFVGRHLTLGPITDRTYRKIAPLVLACGHTVIALSATDLNLAQQLNILLYNLGMPKDRILMDPTTAALGYGMEYCYSVMERIQIGALAVDDADLQQPMINFIGEEAWRVKEAGLSTDEYPELGQAQARGVMLESAAAVSFLVAGSSVISLRHPKSLKLVRSFIELMDTGDAAKAPGDFDIPITQL